MIYTPGKRSGTIFSSIAKIIARRRVKACEKYFPRWVFPVSPATGVRNYSRRLVWVAKSRSCAVPVQRVISVALDSGGGYAEIRYSDDLGAAFARVADELHSQYLLGFALPNFYFHVTTAYNILRHNGVVLAKRDYIGTP